MSVTLTVALCTWLASGFVEYKVIKDIPFLQRFFHGVWGVAISLGISAVIGYFAPAAAGAGVFVGAMLGMATNEFTLKLYTNLHNAHLQLKSKQEKVSQFKAENQQLWDHALTTLKMGGKVIVGLVLGIVYVFGLIGRTIEFLANTGQKTRSRLHPTQT